MSGAWHPWTGLTWRVNLGVLTRWVPPELVAGCVSGRVPAAGPRPSPLTPEFMVYFLLGRALWSQDSYDDVLDNLVAGVPELAGATVDKSSLTDARVRLGESAMTAVFQAVASDPVAGDDTPGARWAGRLVVAVDSFTVDVQDTPANREEFGGPVGGTKVKRVLGYPQARVLTVAECGSHGLRAAAIGGYLTGERELAVQVLDCLDASHVVLFDAGFPSVDLIGRLNATGAAWVMRADRRLGHRDVQVLPDGSATAMLVESGHSKCVQCSHRVRVRVIDYHLGGRPIRLLTSLLDPEQAPAGELAALYGERWQTEHANREIKTIQQGHDYVVRSGSPQLVRQEIWAHLTLHVLLNRLAVDLAEGNHTDPDRISFIKVLKHARRTVIAQITGMAKSLATDLRRWLNPARPPRRSDRTIKRTKKRYNRRNAPTGTKPVTTRIRPRSPTIIPITP